MLSANGNFAVIHWEYTRAGRMHVCVPPCAHKIAKACSAFFWTEMLVLSVEVSGPCFKRKAVTKWVLFRGLCEQPVGGPIRLNSVKSRDTAQNRSTPGGLPFLKPLGPLGPDGLDSTPSPQPLQDFLSLSPQSCLPGTWR